MGSGTSNASPETPFAFAEHRAELLAPCQLPAAPVSAPRGGLSGLLCPALAAAWLHGLALVTVTRRCDGFIRSDVEMLVAELEGGRVQAGKEAVLPRPRPSLQKHKPKACFCSRSPQGEGT